jgi:protein arginine N-methyltransferase 1
MTVQLEHHSDMLGDTIRLAAFRLAIDEIVQPGDAVLDIGTGLGPLAAGALDAGAGHVTAVEYLPDLAALAADIIADKTIRIVVGRSYDIDFSPSPDVIVTETIGPIGPEENIVEITYDLKRRYPGVRSIIPHRVRLYAQEIFSVRVDAAHDVVFAKLNNSSIGHFDPHRAQLALERAYCEQVYQGDLSDAQALSKRLDLADYLLGTTEVPDFAIELELSAEANWNAVTIFFEAVLSDAITLTNHFSAPQTHWLNSYVPRLGGSRVVQITYDGASTSFAIRWLDERGL